MFQSFIKSGLKESKNVQNYSIGNIDVQVFHLPSDKSFNLQKIRNYVLSNIPENLLQNVDSIKIGQFEQLKQKKFDSIYQDGEVLISSDNSAKNILINIVHEIAHSLETDDELFSQIYGEDVEMEFVGKRKKLMQLLKHEKINTKFPSNFLTELDYDVNLDAALLEIGYDNIEGAAPELFMNPYSVTSLREYYATGFQEYIMGNKTMLNNCCPILYQHLNDFISEQ